MPGCCSPLLERVPVEGERLARHRAQRREDPAPERGATLGREPVDRCAARRRFERVGACTTYPASLNATTPIRMLDGWSSTKARAARFAATMRVGVEVLRLHARRHVEGEDHRAFPPRQVDVASGRASPTSSTTIPTRNTTATTWRRHPSGLPVARCAARPSSRARPRWPRAAGRSTRTRPRAPGRGAGGSSAPGARKRHRRPRRLRTSTMRTSTRTRSSSVDRS